MTFMGFSFNDKTVLVTGASSGIGKEIAKSFYDSGASILFGAALIHSISSRILQWKKLREM